ncbi:hypothetical protein EDB89DRAFT_1904491 [Lactarius sanguifluus]|nr:hypothetical protein EDB89DRAFT_1904491 [Lactarius sanguifluus]
MAHGDDANNSLGHLANRIHLGVHPNDNTHNDDTYDDDTHDSYPRTNRHWQCNSLPSTAAAAPPTRAASGPIRLTRWRWWQWWQRPTTTDGNSMARRRHNSDENAAAMTT